MIPRRGPISFTEYHWMFMENHDFYPEIFYWIDYSCLDQNNPNAGVPLLPLWVASCERFLKIDTPNYNQRAWCRLEPLLSHVFSFADHLNTIGLNFKSNWPNTGVKKYQMFLCLVYALYMALSFQKICF